MCRFYTSIVIVSKYNADPIQRAVMHGLLAMCRRTRHSTLTVADEAPEKKNIAKSCILPFTHRFVDYVRRRVDVISDAGGSRCIRQSFIYQCARQRIAHGSNWPIVVHIFREFQVSMQPAALISMILLPGGGP